jgi:uncharacterized protein YlxW (UPF0749 family)
MSAPAEPADDGPRVPAADDAVVVEPADDPVAEPADEAVVEPVGDDAEEPAGDDDVEPGDVVEPAGDVVLEPVASGSAGQAAAGVVAQPDGDQPDTTTPDAPTPDAPTPDVPTRAEPVAEDPAAEDPVAGKPVEPEPDDAEFAAGAPSRERRSGERRAGEGPAEPSGPSGLSHQGAQDEPAVRARTRVLAAMRPKANRGQILAALLCAGLGFGLVAQVQQNQDQQFTRLRQSDLVQLLDDVNTQYERLQGDERALRDARDKLLNQESAGQEAQAQARSRLEVLRILSGTAAATGPGITLVIDDPKLQVGAPTLLDTLQELRDAGAEAIQIGTVRVVASTAFADQESGVQVGGTVLRPPYAYLVIGDPDTLDAAMRIPGGVLDVLEQKGATGRITTSRSVVVDALHTVTTPQYARPAPDSTP